MLRRVLALAIVTLSLACVVKVNEGGTDSPPDKNDSSKPNGPAVAEPEAEGTPIPRAEVPELPDCPADADADTYCTDAGKLAGRWAPVDTIHPPTSAQPIFTAENPDLEKQPSLTISLDKGTLYIERVTCGSCRRIIGHGFSGTLDAL